MRISIKSKLLALVLGVCSAALVAACIAFVAYDRRSSANTKRDTMQVLVEAIAGSAFGPTAFQDQSSAEYVLKTLASEATALSAGIYVEETGALLASWTKAGVTPPPAKVGDKAPSAEYVGDELRIVRAMEKDGQKAGVLVVVLSTNDLEARTREFFKIAGAILVGAFLFSLLAGLRFHRVITEPVSSLGAAAAKVREQNDYGARATKVSNDELGVLTDAFNQMLDGIQSRDRELEGHRQHLEALVERRTRALDDRNRAMRLVLDNVEQGFVTVEKDGSLSAERSRVFDDWFGVPKEGQALSSHLSTKSPTIGDWFALGLETVVEDCIPLEVAIDQMPRRMDHEGATYTFGYKPILVDGDLSKLLVIITDITDQVEREKMEAAQRQFVTVFERAMRDRTGFLEFCEESERLLTASAEETDLVVIKRLVHTLKGNFGLFGLTEVAEICHQVEDRIAETERAPTKAEIQRIATAFGELSGRVLSLVGVKKDTIDVKLTVLDALATEARAGAPGAKVASVLESWKREPVEERFARLADQTRTLAKRLDKGTIDVVLEPNDVRLPAEHWATFWSAFTHVLRNAVDHGLELPDAREQAGKSRRGKITLRTKIEGDVCSVEIVDDGKGIDWQAVAAKAEGLGLPSDTTQDLRLAIFTDGVSTKAQVSSTSGRGVGMAAMKEVCDRLGGSIAIDSKPGEGTRFAFTLPIQPHV
jgi:two-component system, chemotaxis family, sensor kinase CheA